MAQQLTTEGEMKDMGHNPTLDEMQAVVGGYIEYVPLCVEAVQASGFAFLYCNEQGKLQGLPANMIATMLAFGGANHDIIVGDVVLCKANEEEE